MDEISDSKPAVRYRFADQRETWQIATQRIRANTYFAASFTGTIRTLIANHEENQTQARPANFLNPASEFLLGRLIKAPSILAPFYYLTLTYHGEKIADREFITRRDIISIYQPHEIAAVLGLVYLYRRMKHVCDPEEWVRFSKSLCDIMDIGGYFGKSFPGIGLANGMLVSGIRFLSQAFFMRPDLKKFKNYRRDAKIMKKCYDQDTEFDNWGCTNIEISAQILQALGFGVAYSQSFLKSISTDPSKELPESVNLMRICQHWTEALYLGVKPPVIRGEDKLITSDLVLDQIIAFSRKIREEGSSHSWVTKGKNSISRKVVSNLVLTEEDEQAMLPGKAPGISGEDEDDARHFAVPYDHIPEPIRIHFSEESFTVLSQEISDLLGQG